MDTYKKKLIFYLTLLDSITYSIKSNGKFSINSKSKKSKLSIKLDQLILDFFDIFKIEKPSDKEIQEIQNYLDNINNTIYKSEDLTVMCSTALAIGNDLEETVNDLKQKSFVEFINSVTNDLYYVITKTHKEFELYEISNKIYNIWKNIK